MGWSILVGSSGGVLSEYTQIGDIELYDNLYDYGAAVVILTGLGGGAAPAQGGIVKIVWDRGLASEQVHWQGYITAATKKQQGSVYVLRCFTLDALLHISQTGAFRNYLARTPHSIIQGAGSPSNLLTNSQGTVVLTYGTSASVPNKVETASDRMGSFSGTIANDQFVADSTTLLANIRRLCLQGRYTFDAAPDGSSDADLDGSYGLEWTTTLEGANGSSPRFYLVKRRESRASYTPEVFNIPTDFANSRRGGEQAPGADAVKVVGGGDGESRIESALAGTGARELVAEDKAIFKVTNADNMANRLLGINLSTIDVIQAIHFRHASPTRAGDTITVTQTGVANLDLRVMARHYSLHSKTWTFVVGRPMPIAHEAQQALIGITKTDTTTPQYTDVKPERLETATQFVSVVLTAPVVVNPGAIATVIIDSNVDGLGGGSLTELGLAESLMVRALIKPVAGTLRIEDGGHALTYDKTTSIGVSLNSSGAADVDPHSHTATPNHTSTAVGGTGNAPLLAGPFQLDGFLQFTGAQQVNVYEAILPHLAAGRNQRDKRTYPFAASNPADSTDFTPTRVYLQMFNYGDYAITIDAGSVFNIYKNNLHRHNEI